MGLTSKIFRVRYFIVGGISHTTRYPSERDGLWVSLNTLMLLSVRISKLPRLLNRSGVEWSWLSFQFQLVIGGSKGAFLQMPPKPRAGHSKRSSCHLSSPLLFACIYFFSTKNWHFCTLVCHKGLIMAKVFDAREGKTHVQTQILPSVYWRSSSCEAQYLWFLLGYHRERWAEKRLGRY